ncbi:aconitase family protein, partial [Georgenia sp. 10Sc9-8]|nr:aconitase family protein [Georgenia halotolerans]
SIFPVDQVTLDYLRLTGRDEEQIALVEAYAKEQGLWHDPSREAVFSEYVELDLSTVVPSIAGPRRPQDRINLTQAKEAFAESITDFVGDAQETESYQGLDESVTETFPASDPIAANQQAGVNDAPHGQPHRVPGSGERPHRRVPVTLEDGTQVELDHGAVVISAITSCTNTSNPSVMLAAALLAKNAADKGLRTKPWVKTSMAPGSKVVHNYYDKAGLWPALE